MAFMGEIKHDAIKTHEERQANDLDYYICMFDAAIVRAN
jgi:hypothetical protein